jgi:hypothetical protein
MDEARQKGKGEILREAAPQSRAAKQEKTRLGQSLFQ